MSTEFLIGVALLVVVALGVMQIRATTKATKESMTKLSGDIADAMMAAMKFDSASQLPLTREDIVKNGLSTLAIGDSQDGSTTRASSLAFLANEIVQFENLINEKKQKIEWYIAEAVKHIADKYDYMEGHVDGSGWIVFRGDDVHMLCTSHSLETNQGLKLGDIAVSGRVVLRLNEFMHSYQSDDHIWFDLSDNKQWVFHY
jgi:hypothetical protein